MLIDEALKLVVSQPALKDAAARMREYGVGAETALQRRLKQERDRRMKLRNGRHDCVEKI